MNFIDKKKKRTPLILALLSFGSTFIIYLFIYYELVQKAHKKGNSLKFKASNLYSGSESLNP